MASHKKPAVLIGVLFILATVMGVINAGLVGPLVGDGNYLVLMSESAGLVMVSTLLNIIMASAVVAIAVVIYPVLKQFNETLAIGYLSARLVEGIVLAVGGLAWLAIASLGHDFVLAGQPDASHFQSLGDFLIQSSTAMFTLGAEVVFGITALILNYIFIKTLLVPRIISVWGFIGGVLLLTLGVMKILGMPVSAVEIAFTAPIALNEMVLAIWLIIKGFATPSTN